MNNSKNASNGPDPAVHEAIHGLNRTELSPLEETMFQAWASANQLDEHVDSPDSALDMRDLYKRTGGKVQPPGQLKREAEKASHIQTLMEAQEAHDASSPIKALMDAQGDHDSAPTAQAGGDNIVWGT